MLVSSFITSAFRFMEPGISRNSRDI